MKLRGFCRSASRRFRRLEAQAHVNLGVEPHKHRNQYFHRRTAKIAPAQPGVVRLRKSGEYGSAARREVSGVKDAQYLTRQRFPERTHARRRVVVMPPLGRRRRWKRGWVSGVEEGNRERTADRGRISRERGDAWRNRSAFDRLNGGAGNYFSCRKLGNRIAGGLARLPGKGCKLGVRAVEQRPLRF